MIVGGGASGLSAAGALARRGIASTVLERDAAIGGTWSRRYDRLHLHTMREFSGLAHFPIPARYPRYLSRQQFAEYLKEYADHFGLDVVTDTEVHRIARVGDCWAVDDRRARIVVIATGQYGEPVVPAWPGRDLFEGRLLHSSAYANAAPFAGMRVLVVGAGNSGAEIATDLAEGGSLDSARAKAAFVALSVRTPPPIVPRDPFGLPVQRTSLLLSTLPPAVADRVAWTTARLAVGDLSRYGMPRAEFTPYGRRHVPLIDVGFVAAVKRGAIAIRPAVADLTADGARFVHGAAEQFDVIVAATGFTSGLRALLDADGVLDAADEPTGRSGEPTSAPGLYFVGFVHSLRGHLFEANRASRRLARHIERELKS